MKAIEGERNPKQDFQNLFSLRVDKLKNLLTFASLFRGNRKKRREIYLKSSLRDDFDKPFESGGKSSLKCCKRKRKVPEKKGGKLLRGLRVLSDLQ